MLNDITYSFGIVPHILEDLWFFSHCIVALMQSLWKAVPFLASFSYTVVSVSSGFFLALLPLFPLYLELSVFPYVDMGPWQYAECTSLLVQSDSDLLTYTQWQDQNRPVHTFHKPDGSFECVFVFAWDKSVSIRTYLPSHTYEIHQ